MDQSYLSSNLQNFPSIPNRSLYDVVYTSASPSMPHNYASHSYSGHRQQMLAYQFASYSQPAIPPPRTPSTIQTGSRVPRDSCKGSKEVPLDVIARRRAQNRASQRAYRNRKDSHIQSLEARLSEMKGNYEKLMAEHERCRTDFEKLRAKLDFEDLENVQLKDNRRSQSSHSGTGSEGDIYFPSEDESLNEEYFEFDGQVPIP